jgi:hypothetical protein
VSNAHTRAVARAEKLVAAFEAEGFQSYDEDLTDMVADLFHYIHQLRADGLIDETVDDIVVSATNHYYAEIEENE